MTLKSLFATVLMLGGLASGQALASYQCTLGVDSASNPVPVGQPYSVSVHISFVDFGPYPPPSYKPFAVVFHGTRNGVWDTGSGQHLFNAAGNYTEVVGTYNPGGVAGDYIRYALIYRDGQFICSTNSVYIGLL